MSLRDMRRLLARVLVIGALTSGAGATPGGAMSANAAPSRTLADGTRSTGARFVSDINAARAAHGVRALDVADDLTHVARAQSQRMAARRSLYHNPNLTTDIRQWRSLGENVGEGPTVPVLHDTFMNSPEHRANILDPDFTDVGVGVVVDGTGTMWVTEDFRSSSPRNLLVIRLHHLRSTRPAVRPVDPVAKAYDYVSTVARLAG